MHQIWKVFIVTAANRTRCAVTAANGRAMTSLSIRNAAESASKAATVLRARRWTRSVSAFQSTNVHVFIKELNIRLDIRNLDPVPVHQTYG